MSVLSSPLEYRKLLQFVFTEIKYFCNQLLIIMSTAGENLHHILFDPINQPIHPVDPPAPKAT